MKPRDIPAGFLYLSHINNEKYTIKYNIKRHINVILNAMFMLN